MQTERPSLASRQPFDPRLPYVYLLTLLFFTTLGCASVPTVDQIAPSSGDEANHLLNASVEAHGGDVYQQLDNVAVSYDGRWGRMVQRIQPVLTDTGYRKSSEERLWLAQGRLLQRHEGPAGVKTVSRHGSEVEVAFFPLGDGGPTTAEGQPADEEERAAAALVADAYEMFLLGPSFLARRGDATGRLEPERIDGRLYDRLLIRIVPGFGLSAEDRVVAWVDRDDRRLFRVLFTLDGLESTRGAAVDVTFYDHRWIGGFLWPTRFVERVRKPLQIFAHEWSVAGLELDRPRDVSGTEPTDLLRLAEHPAEPLSRADAPPAAAP